MICSCASFPPIRCAPHEPDRQDSCGYAMSRRPARYTEADLKKAMKIAGVKSGEAVVRVLPDGTIEFTPIRPQESAIVPAEEDRVIVF